MNECDNITREQTSEPYEFVHPMEVMEPEEDPQEVIKIAADYLVRILEWMVRGKSLLAIGMRTMVVVYLVRPELIAAQTLESLGSILGMTRQNVDNLVSDFRDTFGNLQFRNTRSEATRQRSRDSHLKY